MSESQRPTANSTPGSHCSSCGAPYHKGTSGWPRTCPACDSVAYRNPLPVAVALQPVYDTQGTALVVITRTIAPARGGTALPGGYVDDREDWRQAVVRELAGARIAEAVYHDLAGWLMMPLALALLWAELWLLSHLLVGPTVRTNGDALSVNKNN